MTRSFLVADLFCGAGGSSTGAEKAVRAIGGEMVLVAVNHWPIAIETHQKNHPGARHYCIDLDAARPEVLVPEGKLDLLMASPECVFFSRARGGKPVSDQRRMSAWHVQRWCTALDVRCLLIENVPEFVDWGPLNGDKPDKAKKGLYFQAWIKALWELGYTVDFKVVNAADHGDATTRRRFFLQARKDGKPIRWPEPSHRNPGTRIGTLLADDRPTWRAAREIIDWTNAGRSLIDDPKYLKKPLSEKTRKRIARGLAKFGGPLAPLYINLLGLEPTSVDVADGPVPFVGANRNNNVPRDSSEPIPSPTTANGGGSYVVTPELAPFVQMNRRASAPRGVDEPVPTITAAGGGGLYAVNPTLVPFVLGQQSGSVARATDEPIPTVCAGGAIALVDPIVTTYNGNGQSTPVTRPLPTATAKARFGLVEPFVLSRFSGWEDGGVPARGVDRPLSTIVGSPGGAGYVVEPFLAPFRQHSGEQPRSRSVDDPLPTITAGGKNVALVQPFIVPKFGEAPGQEPRVHDLADPLPAVTGDGAGRLVTPVVVRVTQPERPGDIGNHVRSADDPLYTMTSKRDLGLAQPVLKQLRESGVDPRRIVFVDGVPHLLDIRFRMLTNRELARAMGFDDAETEYEFIGTVEQVTKQIGNAVPVRTAAALVTAILRDAA